MTLSFSVNAQLNIFKGDSVTIGKLRVPAQLSLGGAIRLNENLHDYYKKCQ